MKDKNLNAQAAENENKKVEETPEACEKKEETKPEKKQKQKKDSAAEKAEQLEKQLEEQKDLYLRLIRF